MFGELQRDNAWRLALHRDRVDDLPERFPDAAIQIASCGRRSACSKSLDVYVLLIHAHDREAEPDARVVSCRDARDARFARADDIPSRADEVREVSERRSVEVAVWIVCEKWVPGRRGRSTTLPPHSVPSTEED